MCLLLQSAALISVPIRCTLPWSGAEVLACCRYQDVEKVGAITKNIRLHLETNLGVDQRLPLGTCLTVSSIPELKACLQSLGPRLALWI